MQEQTFMPCYAYEFSELIYLYIGCNMVVRDDTNGDFVDDFAYTIDWNDSKRMIGGYKCDERPLSHIKLILRPFSSMTQFEENRYFDLTIRSIDKDGRAIISETPASFVWLIKNRFDIFGWLLTGEAVQLDNIGNLPLIKW